MRTNLSNWGNHTLSIAAVLSATLAPPFIFSAHDQTLDQDRWIEIDYPDQTITYDLKTVRPIQPGKFTIISTNIYKPDVLRLHLRVLDTLKGFCARPDGQYQPPTDLFVLGPPDRPVEKIVVKTRPVSGNGKKFKNVVWKLPYSKTASGSKEDVDFFDCEGPAVGSTDKEYQELRSSIMNGTTSKELYDCRRGVMGWFLHKDDPFSKAMLTTNIKGAFLIAYMRLCYALTNQMPYLSPNPPN